MQASRGFTLIELMVVLSIVAILAAIAVPSFRTQMLDGRLTSTSNSLLGAMQVARSEAVTLRTSVKVCAANTAQNACGDSTDWSNGVLIMQGTTLMRVVPSTNKGVTATASSKEIVYKGDGTTSATTITISDERGDSSKRTLKVNIIGQACGGSTCS